MTRVRLGIVGAGAIAQIQYLPLLSRQPEAFEIAGIADYSGQLLDALGEKCGVPPERRFRDYRDLVQSDLDGVIVCPSGSHAPAAIAAAEAGKHVLVEKPMCVTVGEARNMAAAAEKAGTIMMVAYMKRYDPAYQLAREHISQISDIRFIQVNHLHPDNSLHVANFDVLRFDDIPEDVRAAGSLAQEQLVAAALDVPAGETLPAGIPVAFANVLGSLIHDIGNLSGLFGPPLRVLSTEIWAEGRGISTTLEYPGEMRAVCSWVDLPELNVFEETLEVYGGSRRVIATFPTGFSIGQPSTLTLHGARDDGTPWRTSMEWRENAFGRELQHFRQCILTGQRPETSVETAVDDIALVRDIVLAYLNRTQREG